MTLIASYTDIENYKDVCYDADGEVRPETKALVFLSMSVGLGKITEANAAEFYSRATIVERLHGTLMVSSEGEHRVSPEDVKHHIGLTTNVPDETRVKWARRMITGKTGFIADFTRFYNAQASRKSEPVS